jgi:hypothetical protein
VGVWQDGEIGNWQVQHPPLYYAVVGYAVRLSGVSRLVSAHRVARLISAAMFATTGLMLTAFITGPWRASPRTALFVCLLPMWYVMGGRISNDALAIPALGLALLIAIDQMRRPVGAWRLSAWLMAAVAAAIGLAAKAYGLAFVTVAAMASGVAIYHTVRSGTPRRMIFFPLAAVALVLAADGWWLVENQARGAGFTGQNENVSLAARGVAALGDRLPYAATLLFEQPAQVTSAIGRGGAQALYASNWTLGAAPWWFYVLQIVLLATIAGPLVRAPWRTWPEPLRATVLVSAAALATLGLGIAKSVLDFFILFGETRLAQGFYVWGVGPAFTAVLALALNLASPARQRLAVLAQAVCLTVALATDLMFWSGLYERHPVWRSPARQDSHFLPPTPYPPPPTPYNVHHGTSTDLEGLPQGEPREHPREGVSGD